MEFRQIERQNPDGTFTTIPFEKLVVGDKFRDKSNGDEALLIVTKAPEPCTPEGNFVIEVEKVWVD